MKCTECGGEMQIRKGTFKHKALGLPNVTLAGVEIRTCKECGEEEVVIARAEELNRTIVRLIVGKAGRLAGPEIRFLRKFIGWSGSDFARHFGVEPTTISRWENGHEPIGTAADRLLRLSVAYGKPVASYEDTPLESVLDAVRSKDATPVRLKLMRRKENWVATPATA